ncbi:MAG: hypothetical protein HYV40_02245 [Candidatus Levybacteria bacterium]|nr:hypothetical protein [Candidatus Levybacteria bacterium]
MSPQEGTFSGGSLEQFQDREPYIHFGSLYSTEHFVLTSVTSALHEAGLADIVVLDSPSADAKEAYALKWSSEALEKSKHPVGALWAGVHIARAAMLNVIDRGDQLVYHRVLDEEVENQVTFFRDKPELFQAFSAAIEESNRVDASQVGTVEETALSHLSDFTKVMKKRGDGGEVAMHDLYYYPSIGVFLYDRHTKSQKALEMLLSSDSVVAHEQFLMSLDAAAWGLLSMTREKDAIVKMQNQYLKPLLRVCAEGSGMEHEDARIHLQSFYERFFDPRKGQFEGRLPEDYAFRRFVYDAKSDIIQAFFNSTNDENLYLTRNYFEQRGQTAEARLILFSLLERVSGHDDKLGLLIAYIEECFGDTPLVADSLSYFLELKILYPQFSPKIGNNVLQRIILSLREDKHIGDISRGNEVMVPNILYGDYIVECIKRYQYQVGDDHARRFLARLDSDEFPSNVRILARSKKANPVRPTHSS